MRIFFGQGRKYKGSKNLEKKKEKRKNRINRITYYKRRRKKEKDKIYNRISTIQKE